MFGSKIITALVSFFFGIIEVLLAFRLVMKLFGANPLAPFSDWIYKNSDSLVAPFEGIFPSPNIANGLFTLEISAIFALVVYAVVAYMINEIIQFFENFPPKPKSKKTDQEAS